ncbi:MAG: TIGR03936 family radical SAM-associated protein [Mobilicoccus sp.]|nr:TIGR03936 family radical SAM-associated protein [Mobilicoccus sp.]
MARQRVPEGPPAAPAVQKLRIRYAKRGRLRFSSTRDFQRSLERAVRRAGVPMAYSSGFHPHPKISYANAAPTGTASEAEYVEISVVERLDPERLAGALDAALPPGLDVVHVAEAQSGALADLLQASLWRMEFQGMDAADLSRALEVFLAEDEVLVTRSMKKGPRTFDVRQAVLDVEVADPSDTDEMRAADEAERAPCAILHVVVRHTTPVVRPDDVLTALSSTAALTPPAPPLVTRLAQGPLLTEPARVADPLAADQEAVGARPVTRLTRADRA